MNFQEIIQSPDYDFLRTNPYLGDHILVLALGGSHAYGTNVETSDLDIRGVAANEFDNLLLGKDFEQITNEKTDTTIYSLKKRFHLLSKCNPNIVEIIGLEDDQILQNSDTWKEVLKNKNIFLSKYCINSFGGYANAQLRRLETKSARLTNQTQMENYIIGSIENASVDLNSKYPDIGVDDIKLYIDKSNKEEYDSEIMIDAKLNHIPLRDFASLINDYHAIIRGYDKIGKRNSKAIEHNKLGKHMMHLVRLYYMAFDILERGEVITKRVDEHDLLMSLRNGDFLKDNIPTPEFYKLHDELDARLNRDKESTKLPDKPNMEVINDLFLKLTKELYVRRYDNA